MKGPLLAIAALFLAMEALFAAFASASSQQITLNDAATGPIAPGGHVCGLIVSGSGFGASDPVDWQLYQSNGQIASSFRAIADAAGTFRSGAVYAGLGPFLLRWQGSGASGDEPFVSDCAVAPAAPSPSPTSRPTVPPAPAVTMPPTDAE